MFKKVMILASVAEDEINFRNWLREFCGLEGARFDGFATAKDAKRQFNKIKPDLIVVDLNLLADRNASPQNHDAYGLEFVEGLREKVCSIIVAYDDVSVDTKRRVDLLGYGRLIQLNKHEPDMFLDHLSNVLKALWHVSQGGGGGTEKSASSQRVIVAEVKIFEQSGSVKLFVTNSDFEPESFPCSLSPDEMKEILERSMDLDLLCSKGEAESLWRDRITTIGTKIYEAIFGGEPQQHLDYFVEETKLTDRDMRVRFSIPAKISSIIFEALVNGESGRFKVFETPLARQVIVSPNERRKAIGLQEVEALNILVIDASDTGDRPLDIKDAPDFREFLDERNVQHFRTLTHAAEEVDMFENLRAASAGDHLWQVFADQKAKELKVSLNDIRIVNPAMMASETPGEFAVSIKRLLDEGPEGDGDWHIVHFIGHSVAADINRGRAGYLILPGSDVVSPYAVENFFALLDKRKTRFLYFSSCSLGSSDVAIASAQQKVPATLGFRWEVPDKSAQIFSQEFYHGLFCESLAIDEAVRDARRETERRTVRDDTTWVSAVFTCNADRWHAGSGERLKMGGRSA